MGVYAKDVCVQMLPEYNHRIENSKCNQDIIQKQKKFETSSQKNKAVYILIAGLIVVIIGLSVALIVVKTSKITEIRNQKSAPCEDYWIWYQGKCYYFSTERDTWRNSEKFCNSLNASLAIIENKEELDFLFRNKGLDNHWIGMRRKDDNTGWTWTNGTLYNENLFGITRFAEHTGEIEYVFLNHKDVKSQEGIYEYKWICNHQ
ncbi:C-type lectin domain family 2 member D-like [Phyllobates terribilis]|uniref:C-type lectin domain family 2 member D-like n=1 Tax=Phyllobates terribilis TaxID=111132 RepID=UPI003CCB527D